MLEEVVLYAPEMLEGMRRVLFCMFEVVEGELCLPEELEEPDVMRCVLLCILEAVERGLCSLEEVLGGLGGLEGLVGLGGAERARGAGGEALGYRYPVCWRLLRFRNFHCGSFLVTVTHLIHS